MSAPRADPPTTNPPATTTAASSQSPDPVHHQNEPQPTMFGHTTTAKSTTAPRNPAQTLLIFTALVAPLAIVPYVLVRRRLTRIETQLADVCAANRKFARDLERGRGSVEGGLADVRQEVRTAVEREGGRLAQALERAERAAGERDEARRAWEGEMGRRMDALSGERVAERIRRAEELRSIGQSFADAAAFMQEVEVRQGWTPRPHDGRGIERTRRAARELQDAAASMQQDVPQKATPEETRTE